MTNLFRWMDGEKAPGGTVARLPSVHEQEDGTILAVCATGSSSMDFLLSWVRKLEVIVNMPVFHLAILPANQCML